MTEPHLADDDEARIRAELEAEHEERKQRFAEKKERSKAKGRERTQRKQKDSEQALRLRVQEQFHRDHGYKKYVDSRGKTHWLLPEEYDWRVKARAERDKRRGKYKSFEQPGRASWMVWAGMVLVAILMGFALLKGG